MKKGDTPRKMKKDVALLCSMLLVAPAMATAQSQGDWTIGLGVGYVDPESDNGNLAGVEADIDEDVRPIATAEYFVRDNLGVELLVAWPFEHDISLDGVGKIGSTKHLPPTLSLNYHFPTNSPWKPYVGAGVNYTHFFDEKSSLGDLELDASWGFAVQAGIDYVLNDSGMLRLTARYIDIETDAELDDADIGTAEINPIVLSASYVFKF